VQRLKLRALAARHDGERPPRAPVFVLGCPRSGTSLLLRLLGRHPQLRTLGGEGHVLWNTFQHPRLKGWSSDRARAEDVTAAERRFLYGAIDALAGRGRFLEKTPKNMLRIPYLDELFPDARFVLLKRDGRAVVNSLIEGWEVRQSPVYRLPEPLELAEYRGRLWSFVLPPGWRDWATTSIAEVAAFQYASSYDIALPDAAALGPGRVVELRFEDFLARPVEETARLLDALELPSSDAVRAVAADLGGNVVQSNSPPRADKWRQRGDRIAAVLPLIEPTMRRLGYDDVRV
jgi:hypothetical protein